MAAAHRRVADAHQAIADVGHPRNPFGLDWAAQRAAWPHATGPSLDL